MPLITSLRANNEPLGSLARATAEFANAVAAYTLSRSLTAAGIATATVTSQAKIVSTLQYSIAGRQFSKAATDNFWTLSGTTVPAASFQKYLLLIDTAGAASIQEGVSNTVSAATVAFTNVSSVSKWAALLSVLGSTKAVAGVLTIATDATHTFIPGATLLGAAGITATFIDGLDQSLLPILAGMTGSIIGLAE